MNIVTHVSPDFDAIGSVWLLKRYGGMADAVVEFVNTGNADPSVLEAATAVVDTGRVLDPERLRFDHHQLPGVAANDTCATLQVWNTLCRTSDTLPVSISPLIDLIYDGDTGKHGADQSRALGIHALLSAKKSPYVSNQALMEYGFELLDALAERLIGQAETRRTLTTHTVYTSADGLVVALKDAPQGATFAAHEAGARLVLFASELPGPSYARGVMRGGEGTDVHCGALVAKIAGDVATPARVACELDTWYRHEAGFFAGKGTAKAPCGDEMECSIVDIAALIDQAWQR